MNNQIWRWTDLPITEAEIQYVQHEIGLKFPEPLIETFKIGNGGKPSKKSFFTATGIEYIFDSLLNIKKDTEDSIIAVYKDIRNVFPLQSIPFGSDPFGNIYCVSSFLNYPVCIYMHEIDSKGNLMLLNDNYENFINSLV